jgi:hypothetical protein
MLGGTRAFIAGLSDSDYGGNRLTCRSVASFMLYLGIGPVDWRSKQHKYVTLSTGEAEFLSLEGPARAIDGLRWLLKETGVEEIITKFSSALFIDSTVAEALVSNLSVTDKTKHVAIKYHFMRELVLQGILLILRVHTSIQYLIRRFPE